jgi:hypothetical protein
VIPADVTAALQLPFFSPPIVGFSGPSHNKPMNNAARRYTPPNYLTGPVIEMRLPRAASRERDLVHTP